MTKTTIQYQGNLRCRLTHEESGSVITTDAPKDNAGQGEAFSPTDLVGAALGSCILTVMGIYAKRHNIVLEGATASVDKVMAASPLRRIGQLTLEIHMPAGIPVESRSTLEQVAHTCPVHQSLSPEINLIVHFFYPD